MNTHGIYNVKLNKSDAGLNTVSLIWLTQSTRKEQNKDGEIETGR